MNKRLAKIYNWFDINGENIHIALLLFDGLFIFGFLFYGIIMSIIN